MCGCTAMTLGKTLPSWAWAAWEGEVDYDPEILKGDSVERRIVWHDSTEFNYETQYLEDNIMVGFSILQFWTTSARFNIVAAHRMYEIPGFTVASRDWESSLRHSLITDQEGKSAGEIIMDTASTSLPLHNAEFILICKVKSFQRRVWQDGWGGRNKDIYVYDEPYGPGVQEREILRKETKDWSYFKVMLITGSHDCAQRVAVGTIDTGAWEAYSSELQLIQLA